MEEEIKNLKSWSIYQRVWSIYIKQCQGIVWSVKKIQKVKIQKV